MMDFSRSRRIRSRGIDRTHRRGPTGRQAVCARSVTFVLFCCVLQNSAGPHTHLLDPIPEPKGDKLVPKIAVFEAILSAPTTSVRLGKVFGVTKAVCLHYSITASL